MIIRTLELFCFLVVSWFFLFLPQTCLSSVRRIGKVSPGFQASQMQFIDNSGLFLVSNTSSFAFGFNANSDITSFTLVIIHMSSSRIIWSANRDYPVGNSDSFVFNDDGNAILQSKGKVVWSTNTAKNGVSAMELLDSGNLVFVKDDGVIVWQSFSHPTNTLMVIVIVIAGKFVIIGLVIVGIRYHKKNNDPIDGPDEISEEDTFLENISGMPIRFSYKDLQEATNNFTTKLGQGGFGSVYQGVLKDGSRIAVKQLEGIGQGKKEFRAEVSIIGSIHHHHLVKLKGFCAQGKHRLLVYEYMANGSLDRWIFGKFLMDWDTRYNIAIGTAKGLAYLHEDCDVKIIHCDIKPENVLLDDNFLAKVSDFGLAKLMTREESHVFTTLRGTRGYLAPEWITNCAISEKSDVYSYGMVLLEIISGRKNYSSSEISQFPVYAFKMMEEGKVEIIVDEKMKVDENDERVAVATRVALWCIQDDMNLRPSMTKVVRMLEGLCPVPVPPIAAQTGSRFYSGFFKSVS